MVVCSSSHHARYRVDDLDTDGHNVDTDGTLRPWLSGDNVGTVWSWMGSTATLEALLRTNIVNLPFSDSFSLLSTCLSTFYR